MLGFFTGMIVFGIALVSWQMLPFGPGLLSSDYQRFYGQTALKQPKPPEYSASRWEKTQQIKLTVSEPTEDGWASYNRYNQKMQQQAAPFPYADDFVIWLIEKLGGASLAGQQRFARVHPDLLLEVWANRNAISSLSRQAAAGGDIMQAKWEQASKDHRIPGSDRIAGILTLELSSDASDEQETGRVIRFKGTQVRLVGVSGKSYWPKGIYLDGFPWASLYGNLDSLTAGGDEGASGYLRYKSDYYLWAKDITDQRHILREIRGCQPQQMWWQLQMQGASGELSVLPGSLGVVQEVRKGENATVKLLFEIEPKDQPDYVTFKRTAIREVELPKVEATDEPNTTVESPEARG